MRVDVIADVKALAAARAEWDGVYAADPEAQFFLSWTWIAKWLAALNRSWFVLAARADGEGSPYVAFLPLWIATKEHKAGGFYNDVQLGGNYSADYTGFICRPEREGEAIPAFAQYLQQLNWAHLRLEFLRASEHRTALFMQAFPARAFGVGEIDRLGKDNVDNSRCLFAPLSTDWDTYLDGRLSANSRQKMRRLLRRIDDSAEFRITHADRGSLERDIGILMQFWSARWGAEKGAQLNGIVQNYRLMLRHTFDAGALFLPMLWQGERPLAGLAILVDAVKKSFLFFTAGRDETFDDLPAGLALHAHSIRHAIRNGFVVYDFLRGNETYKYSFGVEERRVTSFVLTTKDEKNLGGRLHGSGLRFALDRSLEHHRAGRSLQAELGFRQVLDLEPGNADALCGLGQILAKRGEHPRAIALLRAYVAARPEAVNGWFWLGRSLRACGEFSQAAGAYCEGIQRQPAIAGAYYDLGHILLTLGQHDLAAAAFDAARDLQPVFPDLEASQTRALQAHAKLAPEERTRRAAAYADVRERVGRLAAVAVRARILAEPPFSAPGIGRAEETQPRP
jgi:tetratricopeptide (TPR) repeat protein